jgi:pimeloyl-ACP methyl ester carboxylesterase
VAAELEHLTIEANGLTFTALASGPSDGRPVLLLHGFPQTSWCFAHGVAALGAAGYRAVAPDQRGYATGSRPAEVEAYTVDHLVDDVVAMADSLGMDGFDLVGHDWGGMVAWMAAAAHPDRIRTLTSLSTPHPTALAEVLRAGDEDQVRRSGYLQLFAQFDVPEQLFLGEDGSGDGLRAMFAAAGLDPVLAEPHVVAMVEPGRLTAALHWYRANNLEVPRPLAAIEIPTLYIWSTEDIALGRRAAEATADYVEGPYRFEVLDGVSHWIPDEAPEPVHALLLEHLAAHP